MKGFRISPPPEAGRQTISYDALPIPSGSTSPKDSSRNVTDTTFYQEYRPESEVQAGYPAIDKYVGDEDDTDVDETVTDEHRSQQHFGLIEQVDDPPVSRLFFVLSTLISLWVSEKKRSRIRRTKGEHEQQDYQEDKYRGSCGVMAKENRKEPTKS